MRTAGPGWLTAWIQDHTATGMPGSINCSALKRIYRDRLAGDNVVFAHLTASKDLIGQRLTARMDHFMPATMLDPRSPRWNRRKPTRTP